MKPHDLIGRDAEWTELTRAWNSGRPELCFVLGRRRAGKSYLLTRFVREHRGLYYQATKQTEREQLRAIARAIGEQFDQADLALGVAELDWEQLFRYIARRANDRPYVLVLDEFTYLTQAAPALPSILQKAWDHVLADTKVKVVLSGSYISAMTALMDADQPLFGRRTALLQLAPFSYADAADFMGKYSATDRLLAYGVFGGLPGHLALLDPSRSLAENVGQHLLTPTSRLYDEAAHLLDAFTSDAHLYYAIIDAIANGERTFGGIAKRLGKGGSSLSRPLAWLRDMQIIARVAPLTPSGRTSHKTVQYRLTDPYLQFWYRFLLPIRATGVPELLSGKEIWETHITPGLNDYMGAVFEEVCGAYVRADRGRRLPIRPARLGEWWTPASDRQIDLVAVGTHSELLVGECKWGDVTTGDLDRLQANTAVLAREFGSPRRVEYLLISRRPVRDAALKRQIARGDAMHLTAEELFSA